MRTESVNILIEYNEHGTMCKMAHFARNAVASDDLNIVLIRAILGDLGRAGNLGR